MNRKGFFFIIVAFILLSYILTSTYYWVRAIEMEEARYSESFRTTSMEMLLAQVTYDTIGAYVDISAHYALYRLNHHSINHPVTPAVDIAAMEELDGSENDNIKFAMRELILYGNASGDYFDDDVPLNYNQTEKLIYSLEGWKNQLNASLAASGFELVELEIYENTFEFNQINFTHFELVFEMNLTIVDSQADSSTSLVRSYNVRRLVDATGFVDPYIARESERLNLEDNDGFPTLVGRQIFIHPEWEEGYEYFCSDYSSGDDCYYVGHGSQGQGWFYGPVVNTSDALNVHDNATYNYILAGNYSAIKAVSNYKNFGAYILTNEPTEGGDCGNDQEDTFNPLDYDSACEATIDTTSNTFTTKPFMVYDNFDIDEFIGVDLYSDAEIPAHKVLFVAEFTHEQVLVEPEDKINHVSVYDIEKFRDFAMCGYYMPRNESPSFLHRMFDLQDMFDSNPEPNPAYFDWPESQWGIETLAVGRWAGGNIVEDRDWDLYSRVDVEFFSEVAHSSANEVQMIKGMPGCKDADMCSEDLEYDLDSEHVGHFRMSDWAQDDREEDFEYMIELGPGDTDNYGCDNTDQASCDADE
ncbi:MAG: hypothetical protein GY852_04695 [bacterium]|nr:hypothetical protein [bacterium]